ncbi:MAG TPA: META domain-containing protein [Microbacteriaceae bacterium]|nr:META domain-containing protein [Microbacteriaceae bacterium]
MGRGRLAATVAGAGAVLLLMTACAGAPVSAAGTWGAAADGQPQLVLDASGELSGTDGCNRLIGSWEQKDATIDFGEVGSTMMACDGVDTWLSGLSTGRIDGTTLHILDAGGVEIGTLARG